MEFSQIFSGIASAVEKIIDQLVTSDEERKALFNDLKKIELAGMELDNKYKIAMLSLKEKSIEAQSKVVIAEAQSTSWLQRSWRPGLMAIFGIIIFNNYVLNPYLNALFNIDIKCEVPTQMWFLLNFCICGYVGGRSFEKIAKEGGIKNMAQKVSNKLK